MSNWLLRDVRVVNEGTTTAADVLLRDGFIERIATEGIGTAKRVIEFDAKGKHLLPGAIDDQVHFREPGLTYKDDIAHGSAAAVAGGITTFMEMPNTVPQTLTQELLTLKYAMGAASSVANYSFYMGREQQQHGRSVAHRPENSVRPEGLSWQQHRRHAGG
jgi:dihydroorotase